MQTKQHTHVELKEICVIGFVCKNYSSENATKNNIDSMADLFDEKGPFENNLADQPNKHNNMLQHWFNLST
jgi:hypothetical protein